MVIVDYQKRMMKKSDYQNQISKKLYFLLVSITIYGHFKKRTFCHIRFFYRIVKKGPFRNTWEKSATMIFCRTFRVALLADKRKHVEPDTRLSCFYTQKNIRVTLFFFTSATILSIKKYQTRTVINVISKLQNSVTRFSFRFPSPKWVAVDYKIPASTRMMYVRDGCKRGHDCILPIVCFDIHRRVH